MWVAFCELRAKLLRLILAAAIAGACAVALNPLRAQSAETPDRFLAIAQTEATAFRKRDGKFAPVGKFATGEKVIVIGTYAKGKILAVANKRLKGFVKADKFEQTVNLDEARRQQKKEFSHTLNEVWKDDTEAEDLLTNRNGFRGGLSSGYDRKIGLGFGIPLYYGIALEGARIEIGGEIFYHPVNAGRPLQLTGAARYLFTRNWFEWGFETFVSLNQLLALHHARELGYGLGAVAGFRLTNTLQFNLEARVNFRKGVVPFGAGGLSFTF